MVTDRGQLLLVTAVILAMIVLGMAVMLNSAVTTEVRSPDDPTTDVTEADRIAMDIERGSAGLVGQVNTEVVRGNGDLTTSLESTFDAYADLVFETMGDRRATLTELSFGGVVEEGSYLADPDPDTTLAEETITGMTAVAGLRMSLDLSDTERIVIDITGETQTTEVTVEHTGSAVEIEVDGAVVETCPLGGSTELDLTRHDRSGVGCHVNPFEAIDGDGENVTAIEISNPNDVAGAIQLVVDTSPSELSINELDTTVIAWSVEIELSQWARASERHVTSTIEVYRHPHTIGAMEVPWA